MIANRPAMLLARPGYREFPSLPIAPGLESVPVLIRGTLADLGGIQPITGAMAAAAGGHLLDKPSAGEVALHRDRGTRFQMVSIVVSLAAVTTVDGVSCGVPYCVSLVPAQKRGAVQETGVDFIEKIDVAAYIGETEPCYVGFNPFTGDWSMYGPLGGFLEKPNVRGFVDELGIVLDQYFLATEYNEADLLQAESGFSDPRADFRYNRHRKKLLFRPFNKVGARPIWGAESPIELFLLQELLHRGIRPTLQMIFCDDGSMHGSMHDLWRDREFRHTPCIITQADMYLHNERLAIFCDSAKHHGRAKDIAKDQAIDDRLREVGVRPVRVPGPMIVRDLSAAADLVCRALG